MLKNVNDKSLMVEIEHAHQIYVKILADEYKSHQMNIATAYEQHRIEVERLSSERAVLELARSSRAFEENIFALGAAVITTSDAYRILMDYFRDYFRLPFRDSFIDPDNIYMDVTSAAAHYDEIEYIP